MILPYVQRAQPEEAASANQRRAPQWAPKSATLKLHKCRGRCTPQQGLLRRVDPDAGTKRTGLPDPNRIEAAPATTRAVELQLTLKRPPANVGLVERERLAHAKDEREFVGRCGRSVDGP
jgi:hypothetical protein